MGPEPLENLGAVMPILKLREEHALAGELDLHVELNDGAH